MLEIVEHDHIVLACDQLGDAVAADETGAAGDQDCFLMRHVKLLIDTLGKNPETPGGMWPQLRGDFGVS
ncbi:hypothetical protein SAE02_06710 [Skermanella aerolata]|uniref:Uncharacterized protein n=1 Tax=Skermanella aerolata TaxID=393310 RepID=A0A512DJ63_9PROT|nr:hypothetical protein SAE02_06710 [Skermanella aerolata]